MNTKGKCKKSPTPESFVLPPVDFSNAINRLYSEREFSFVRWQDSKEWKLFNAGMESAADELASQAKLMAEDSGKESRGEGRHNRQR